MVTDYGYNDMIHIQRYEGDNRIMNEKMKLGYLTVYRGNITDMKTEKTEIGIRRFHFLEHRWYLNPSDYSLDRINRIMKRYEPSVLDSEVLDHSVYITFKFKENNIE